MGRGFLAGIFWGGLVGLGMLLVSSQALERQTLSLPQPTAAAVEVPGGSEFDQAREDTDPVVPEVESRPEAEAVELVEAPDDAVENPPAFETSSLEVPTPSVGDAGGLSEAPTAGAAPDAPEISDSAQPVESEANLVVPDAPGSAPTTNDDAPSSVAAPEDNVDNSNPPVVNEDDTLDETVIAGLQSTDEDQDEVSEVGTAPSIVTDDTAPSSLTSPLVDDEPSLPTSRATSNDSDLRVSQATEPVEPAAPL